MAYRKFDDPPLSREDAPRKIHDAIQLESVRRALQGVLNRVVAGSSGTTGGTSFNAGIGTGSTAGLRINYGLCLCVNGRMGTMAPHDNLYLPTGTQSSNTWVKYLVAARFGTRGTVFAGNEGASSTAAKLPDCPDGYVAVGYCEYNTTSGAYIRYGGGTAGAYNVLSGNEGATCGTVEAMVNLMHMPMNEV